jgi:hypothetical protein
MAQESRIQGPATQKKIEYSAPVPKSFYFYKGKKIRGVHKHSPNKQNKGLPSDKMLLAKSEWMDTLRCSAMR